MSTRTTDIVNAIVTCLTNAGLAARASTGEPWSFEATDSTAAIVVDVGGESPEGRLTAVGFVYWNLAIELHISANGAIPKLAPEATRQAAHVALYADRTFGGLAIDIVADFVKRGIDSANTAAGRTSAGYTVMYRIGESTA